MLNKVGETLQQGVKSNVDLLNQALIEEQLKYNIEQTFNS